MKKKLISTLLLACLPVLVIAGPKTLCNQFSPAQNKQFADTFSLNMAAITRTGNDKISGQFTNKNRTASITGLCNDSQLSFWWRTPKFEGQFSGTLVCQNGVYNIVNILMTIAGEQPQPVVAMYSPSSGPCPNVP